MRRNAVCSPYPADSAPQTSYVVRVLGKPDCQAQLLETGEHGPDPLLEKGRVHCKSASPYPPNPLLQLSYSLNSLKGGYIGDYIGDYYRVIKGDTRSLDNGSADNSHQPQTPETRPYNLTLTLSASS